MGSFTTTALATNNTAANFRAWINIIHDALTAGGWVQTADTGQIDFGAVGAPGSTNTKMGYAIYRMDDTLQSTAPVFLKLAFGSGNLSAAQPGIWFAIGINTDGNGNFINPNDHDRAAILLDQYSQTQAAIKCNGNDNTNMRPIFGSVGPGHFSILLWEAIGVPSFSITCVGCCSPSGCCTVMGSWGVVANDPLGAQATYTNMFTIERSRDAEGAETGDAVIVQWSATNASLNRQAYVRLSHEYIPLTPMTGFTYQLSDHDFGSFYDVLCDNRCAPCVPGNPHHVTAPIPFDRNTMPVAPGVGLIVSRASHFTFSWPGRNDPAFCECPGPGTHNAAYITGTTVETAPFGGSAHTYRTCSGIRIAGPDGNQDQRGFILVRYD